MRGFGIMWEKIKGAARRFGAWFDAERRQKTQAAIAAVAPLLIMFGLVTQSAVDQYAIIVGATLAAVGPLVSLVNLTRTEFASWLITGARGVLYGAAAVIVPALAALGYVTDEQQTTVLALLSNSLTVISAVVAIFTSARQEKVEVAQTAADVAVVGILSSPLPSQISELDRAATRLGLDPTEVTREAYRRSTE
ncbi:holin [Microbacterium phage Antuna]|nr:holin [Microbacterium phage Antuna]